MRSLALTIVRLLQAGGLLLDRITVGENFATFTLQQNGKNYTVYVKPEAAPDDPRLRLPGEDYQPHEWTTGHPDEGVL